MILCLRTDTKQAEIYLQEGMRLVVEKTWQADRQLAKDLLGEIEAVVKNGAGKWENITGIVVYQGPGSFTGLRIGCSVANAIAYAQNIAIVGTTGDEWKKTGIYKLEARENQKFVMPEYGAEPRITTPRK